MIEVVFDVLIRKGRGGGGEGGKASMISNFANKQLVMFPVIVGIGGRRRGRGNSLTRKALFSGLPRMLFPTLLFRREEKVYYYATPEDESII